MCSVTVWCDCACVQHSPYFTFSFYFNACICFAATATQSCEEKFLAWDNPGQTVELDRAQSEPVLTPVVPFALNNRPCKLVVVV